MKSTTTPKTIEKSIVSTSLTLQIANMECFVRRPTLHRKLKSNFCALWISMMIFFCFITKLSFVRLNGSTITKNVSMLILGKTLGETSSNIRMETGYANKLILKAEFAKILCSVILLILGMSFNFTPWITKRVTVTMNSVLDIFVHSCTQAKVADSDKLTSCKTSTFIL